VETALECLAGAFDSATTRILDGADIDSPRGDPRFEASVAEMRDRLDRRRHRHALVEADRP
jgi:hypothetical protein